MARIGLSIRIDVSKIEKARLYKGEKGISMQNAALDMGLSKTVLWNLEHGFACNPTAKTLNAIRKLYYLSPKQLLNALDK